MRLGMGVSMTLSTKAITSSADGPSKGDVSNSMGRLFCGRWQL
jgi:hypothetical protein